MHDPAVPVRRAWLARGFALTLALLCGGCTTIHVHGGGGEVSVRRGFGWTALHVSPQAGAVTARISGLGYLSTPMGHSLGWTRQTIAAADHGCRVIVWTDGPLSGAQRELLSSIPPSCIVP